MTNGLPEPSYIDKISSIWTPVSTCPSADSESSITTNYIKATIS